MSNSDTFIKINVRKASAMIPLQFIPMPRGGRKLINANYMYRVNKKMREKSFWMCCKHGCTARVTTEQDIMICQQLNHTHPLSVGAQQITAKIRNRAREEITPIPIIYTGEYPISEPTKFTKLMM